MVIKFQGKNHHGGTEHTEKIMVFRAKLILTLSEDLYGYTKSDSWSIAVSGMSTTAFAQGDSAIETA